MIRIFFSHRMHGWNTDEIRNYREQRWLQFIEDAHLYLTPDQIAELTPSTRWVDTIFSAEEIGIGEEDPRYAARCLAKSLSLMASADLIMFDVNWHQHRGCRIEFQVATEYNLNFKIMQR